MRRRRVECFVFLDATTSGQPCNSHPPCLLATTSSQTCDLAVIVSQTCYHVWSWRQLLLQPRGNFQYSFQRVAFPALNAVCPVSSALCASCAETRVLFVCVCSVAVYCGVQWRCFVVVSCSVLVCLCCIARCVCVCVCVFVFCCVVRGVVIRA